MKRSDRRLVEDAEPALAAHVGELLELAQQRAAGVVVADRDDDQRDLGVQPVVVRPLADAVAEPEDQAERDRDHHQQAREAVELPRHHQQPLALGVAVGGDARQVDEDARQVEQAGEPAAHEDDVEGLDPEERCSHRSIIGGRLDGRDGTPRIAPVLTPPPYPASRPRRLRREAWSRDLVRESRVHASDLILPVFVLDGQGIAQDVASMPGVQRVTLDRLYPVAEECVAPRHPGAGALPGARAVAEERRRPRGAQRQGPGAARRARAEAALPRARRDDRRRARSVHEPRPGRPARRDRLHRQRRDRRGARAGRRWCRPRPASTSSRRAT